MKNTLLLLLKIAVTCALLYFASSRANLAALGDRLVRLDPVWAIAALGVVTAQTYVLAVRWREIVASCGFALSTGEAMKFTTISIFFSQVTPATIGGDAVKIWLLARGGAGWSLATYSVLIDRYVGVLALAIMVTVCLPWSLGLIVDPVGQTALALIGFGSVAGLLAFMAIGASRPKWTDRWWVVRHLAQLAVKLYELMFRSGTGLRVMALSLLSHILTATIAWCAARAAFAPFDYVQALLLIPPVILISTVPLSIAGWGVRESALVLAFGYAGLPENDALLVSILFGIAMLAFGVIGGAVWLASGVRLRSMKQESPTQSAL
jgi:glycosyltransferase 2 family protein